VLGPPNVWEHAPTGSTAALLLAAVVEVVAGAVDGGGAEESVVVPLVQAEIVSRRTIPATSLDVLVRPTSAMAPW
jgi:hypothetical protein